MYADVLYPRNLYRVKLFVAATYVKRSQVKFTEVQIQVHFIKPFSKSNTQESKTKINCVHF